MYTDYTSSKLLSDQETNRSSCNEASPISSQEITLPRLLSWARKGSFAVLDQGLFSGTAFLVNILLARWLDPPQYGAFTVAYSVFLLLAGFHSAVLTEPMMVFGAGKYSEKYRSYLSVLLYGHWGMTGIIALILAIAAWVVRLQGSDDLVQALAGLAFASPFILLLWLVRRVFYVHGQPQWPAIGGIFYLVLMLAGMYVLYRGQSLSAGLALVVMGLVSMAVNVWLSTKLHSERRIESHLKTSVVLADHWDYGKWATAAVVLTWVPGSIYYALLPAWFGLEASAALLAVMNLVMPILHAHIAVSVLLLPWFARMLKTQRKPTCYRIVLLALTLFTAGSVCYWGVLFFFGKEMLLWIYGGRYMEYSDSIILAGLLSIPMGVTTVLGTALRALERPDQVFWCRVMAVLTTATLGLWLLASRGLTGAIEGSLASSLTAAAAMTWFYIRSAREIHRS